MTVLITLSSSGASSGPLYDLYSNIDYITPIASGVTKSALTAGYSLSGVPDAAITIRITSTGPTCTNSIDVTITGGGTTTTTTSSTTAAPARSIYNAGISNTSVGDSCSQFLIDPINLFSTCTIPAIGCILYVHPFNNSPLLGNSFAYIDGYGTWDIDTSTGEILSFSSQQC